QLSKVTLLTNRQPALELNQPCRVSFAYLDSHDRWEMGISPFDWAGAAGRVQAQASFNWPQTGILQLAVENLSAGVLAGFTKTNLPDITLRALQTVWNWSNSPAAFRLSVSAAANFPEGSGAAALNMTGDGAGVVLS